MNIAKPSYRIDLTLEESNILIKILSDIDLEKYDVTDKLLTKIVEPQQIRKNKSKTIDIEIQKALKKLKEYNKKITPYQIAKVSGISYVTVRKYLKANDYEV